MPITQILLTASRSGPTYTLTPQTVSADEGSEFTFEISGTNIVDGTYYWTIETGSSEFTTTSGSFNITDNYGVVTVTPDADDTTEGAETFTVSLRSGSITGTVLATSDSITINDTSTTPNTVIMSLNASDYAGSGTTWADSSGYSHPGTLVNSPTYQGANIPKYFTFDKASTQYVQGTAIGDLATWTIESWFRLSEPLSNTDQGAQALITTTYEGTNVINYVLSNYGGGGNTLTAGFFIDGTWYNTSGFVPDLNTWYHVVGTYDGTTLQQWVNGSLNSELAVTATTVANGGAVRIGRRWDGEAIAINCFPGDIATAKIYNYTLTDEEIVSAWDSSKATYPNYILTPEADNVDEGASLTFTVSGTRITNGTYYWTVTNSGDFGTASGTVSVTSNSGTFSVTPTADGTTEGAETFTVSIRSGSISGTVLATSTSVTINDTSLAPEPPFSLAFNSSQSDYLSVGEAGYYGGSAEFSNASLSYISVDPDASLALGTNNFTIEWWQYQTERGPFDGPFGYYTADHSFYFPIGTSQYLLYISGTGGINISGGTLPSLNAWHHVAVVRNSTTFTLYVDGTSVGSAESSVDLGTMNAPLTIGSSGGSDGSTMTGRMTNFRFVNGTAVYTENFTPIRGPLDTIANTKILLWHFNSDNLLLNQTGQPYTITNNNGVSWSSSTPVLDYDFTMGTGWTIEYWSKASGASTQNTLYTVMCQDVDLSNGIDLLYYDGNLQFGGTALVDEPTPGEWTHVALVDDGSNLNIYYNGVSVYSGAGVSLNYRARPIIIGRRGPNNFQYFDGKLALIRIRDAVVYTDTFTPTITYDEGTSPKLFSSSTNPLVDSRSHTITNNGVTISTDFPAPRSGRTAATAGSSAWQIKQDYPNSADGLYWIKNDAISGGTPVQIYADMTTDGGGWTLLVQNNLRSGWDDDTKLVRNTSTPPSSLVNYASTQDAANNYSILGWADYIKKTNYGGQTTFDYMLDAGYRGRNGGIWTANTNYSFVGVYDDSGFGDQLLGGEGFRKNITEVEKFPAGAPSDSGATWDYAANSIEARMPYVSSGTFFLGTDSDGGWYGTILTASEFNPAPWINNANGSSIDTLNPRVIWYWVR